MPGEPEKQSKPTLKATLTLLSLEGLLSGIYFPSNEEYRQLADELEEAPPPDLTPEGLSLVLQILRGEGGGAKFVL